jgi:hypothetical protein
MLPVKGKSKKSKFFSLRKYRLKMILYEFDKRKDLTEKPCGQILAGFALKRLIRSSLSNDEKFADRNTIELCEFALCGLSIKNYGFGLAHLRNLRICDSGMSSRICGFADFKKCACPETRHIF